MKLLINAELSAYILNDDFDDEGLDYYRESCKDYSIRVDIKKHDKGTTIVIPTQKVTLDEEDMNDVFHNILDIFDYNLRYGHIGGKGCMMSLEIY